MRQGRDDQQGDEQPGQSFDLCWIHRFLLRNPLPNTKPAGGPKLFDYFLKMTKPSPVARRSKHPQSPLLHFPDGQGKQSASQYHYTISYGFERNKEAVWCISPWMIRSLYANITRPWMNSERNERFPIRDTPWQAPGRVSQKEMSAGCQKRLMKITRSSPSV